MDTLQHLISEVETTITSPYSDWKIGITDGKLNDESCMSTVVFNPENNSAVLEAYKYFCTQGITRIEPVGANPKYLYLYKNSWGKFPSGIF